MTYPIIKVRDKSNGEVHTVGTDSHDMLYIDDNGCIQYYNLQNGEGTGGDYEFIYEDDGMWKYIKIADTGIRSREEIEEKLKEYKESVFNYSSKIEILEWMLKQEE